MQSNVFASFYVLILSTNSFHLFSFFDFFFQQQKFTVSKLIFFTSLFFHSIQLIIIRNSNNHKKNPKTKMPFFFDHILDTLLSTHHTTATSSTAHVVHHLHPHFISTSFQTNVNDPYTVHFQPGTPEFKALVEFKRAGPLFPYFLNLKIFNLNKIFTNTVLTHTHTYNSNKNQCRHR